MMLWMTMASLVFLPVLFAAELTSQVGNGIERKNNFGQ
jgi:hypothetical protein